MHERELEMLARIEAALYASGRPLGVEELQKAAGTDSANKAVRMARELGRRISSNLQALEVVELPDGAFVLQLKLRYNHTVKRFASRPFLSHATLKTLSCVAYMQPVTSKRIVEVRGSQAYDHLKILVRAGFLTSEKVGRLKIYQTAKKFQDYFGMEGDIEKLKKKLMKSGEQKEKKRTPSHQIAPPILEKA
ncbi:MAG: SMC-Scp complex subunit ScpB [Nitrososphaerales archaeon]